MNAKLPQYLSGQAFLFSKQPSKMCSVQTRLARSARISRSSIASKSASSAAKSRACLLSLLRGRSTGPEVFSRTRLLSVIFTQIFSAAHGEPRKRRPRPLSSLNRPNRRCSVFDLHTSGSACEVATKENHSSSCLRVAFKHWALSVRQKIPGEM